MRLNYLEWQRVRVYIKWRPCYIEQLPKMKSHSKFCDALKRWLLNVVHCRHAICADRFQPTFSFLIVIYSVGLSSFTCDFDDSSLCGFIQSTNDDFDWELPRNDLTPSSKTGPSSDHLGGMHELIG